MTIQDVNDYIKLDDTYDDDYVISLIEISQIYIDSMVGTKYKSDEKMVKLSELLQMKIISDMYDNRSTQVATNTKQDLIVLSILDKLSNCEEVTKIEH